MDFNTTSISIGPKESKEEDTRFSLHLRFDIDEAKFKERATKIEELTGTELIGDDIVITNECESEGAAKEMIEGLKVFKDKIDPTIQPWVMECKEAEGTKVTVHIKNPICEKEPFCKKQGCGCCKYMESPNQYFDLKITSTADLKKLITDEDAHAAVLLGDISFNLNSAFHKDFITKLIKEFIKEAKEHNDSKLKLVMALLISLRRLNLEIDIQKTEAPDKSIYEDEIIKSLATIVAHLAKTADEFGFKEVMKNGEAKTTLLYCKVLPISAEVTLYAPTAVEVMDQAEKLSNACTCQS